MSEPFWTSQLSQILRGLEFLQTSHGVTCDEPGEPSQPTESRKIIKCFSIVIITHCQSVLALNNTNMLEFFSSEVQYGLITLKSRCWQATLLSGSSKRVYVYSSSDC